MAVRHHRRPAVILMSIDKQQAIQSAVHTRSAENVFPLSYPKETVTGWWLFCCVLVLMRLLAFLLGKLISSKEEMQSRISFSLKTCCCCPDQA